MAKHEPEKTEEKPAPLPVETNWEEKDCNWESIEFLLTQKDEYQTAYEVMNLLNLKRSDPLPNPAPEEFKHLVAPL